MKKSRIVLFIFIFIFSNGTPSWAQIQLGQVIYGETPGDNFGWITAISDDGTVVAAGAPYSDSNASNSGYVKVFKWDGTDWNLLGEKIEGNDAEGFFGFYISLSNDGNTLAVGTPFTGADDSPFGRVSVYNWDGSSWNQVGEDIIGEIQGDLFGRSLSLSGDGSILAVSAERNPGGQGAAGQVRIFGWDGSSWNQVGENINGEGIVDLSGRSLALSDDGKRLIIGAIFNEDVGFHGGHARVFEWDGTQWLQLGMDLDAEEELDLYGSFVTISADGNTIAICAPIGNNSTNGFNSGYVKVFDWDGTNWNQFGQTLEGEASLESFGWSISLSSDGSLISIGIPNKNSNGEDAGRVSFFERAGNSWVNIWDNIDGDAVEDILGRSQVMTPDHNFMVVGANGHDDNTGLIKVFGLNPLSINTLFNDAISIEVIPNPASQYLSFPNIENGEVTFFDTKGQLIKRKMLSNQTLDISDLPNNMYFVLIKTEDKAFISKVVKQD